MNTDKFVPQQTRNRYKKLGTLGFQFYRSAKGDHEIWFNPETNQKTIIPYH